MYKLLVLAFLGLLVMGCQTPMGGLNRGQSSSSVVEIVVSGSGIDKEKALQDAFRNAVEIVSGTYLYSESTVSNFQLVKDEIATHTKGFINSYEIRYEQKTDQITTLSVKCIVSREPIKSLIQKHALQTWDDAIGDFAKIQQTQERIRKSANLLKVFVGTDSNEFFKKAYQADMIGYTVESVGMDNVDGYYLVQLSLNTVFWEQYLSILKEVAIGDTRTSAVNTMPEGLFASCPKRIADSYNIPLDLKEYLPPIMEMWFAPGRHEKGVHWLSLDKNTIGLNSDVYGARRDLPSNLAYQNNIPIHYSLKSFLYEDKRKRFSCEEGSLTTEGSIVVKLPFSVRTEADIKRMLNSKKIPWVVYSKSGQSIEHMQSLLREKLIDLYGLFSK